MEVKKKIFDIALVSILLLINLPFLYLLFTGQFTNFPLSIESTFLTETKFIVENFPNIWWYPFWYFGLPFYLVYQPIPIFLTALVSLVPSISIGHAYRILTGIFFVVGVVGVYFWAKYITKGKVAALVSGITFSVLPSVAYIYLFPSWRGYGLLPLRIVNTIVYGEGPHMWGLAFVPFACLYFQKLLKNPQKKAYWIATVLLTSIILLTNLTAFVGLIVFYFFIFFLEASISKFKKKFLVVIVLTILILGLSVFWYNPDFLSAAFGYSLGDGGGIFSGIWGNFVFSLFIIPTFLFVLYLVFGLLRKKLDKKSYQLVLPASLFVFLFIVVWGWFAFDKALFPLPFRTIPRLIPELELTFALLLGSIIARLPKRVGYLAGSLMIVAVLVFGYYQRNNYWSITKPHKDFSTTSEYVVSKKLEEISAKRVYATGTHAFWLNYFSGTVQLRGGKGGDFGGLNPWLAHLSYFINQADVENSTKLTEKWLRSLGLEYIVVNYPGSPVYYHDFDNLERFSEFEEIFNYRGDKILKLPTENSDLALALPKGWAGNIKELENLSSGEIVLNEKRLDEYFSFVEGEGKVLEIEFPFGSWSKMRIPAGQVGGNEEILIRQTFYPGWSARSDGKRLGVAADPIGFTRIENPDSGEIILKFFPSGVVLSSLLSLLVLVFFVVFLKKEWYQRV